MQFEKGKSPLMVGLQSTTSSLAKCYEGALRRINYPMRKNFETKRLSSYKTIDDEPNLATEPDIVYNPDID